MYRFYVAKTREIYDSWKLSSSRGMSSFSGNSANLKLIFSVTKIPRTSPNFAFYSAKNEVYNLAFVNNLPTIQSVKNCKKLRKHKSATSKFFCLQALFSCLRNLILDIGHDEIIIKLNHVHMCFFLIIDVFGWLDNIIRRINIQGNDKTVSVFFWLGHFSALIFLLFKTKNKRFCQDMPTWTWCFTVVNSSYFPAKFVDKKRRWMQRRSTGKTP